MQPAERRPQRGADEDNRGPDAQPEAPPRTTADDRTIVEKISDGRVEHRACRCHHRHDPQPSPPRQRSHTGECDQREDDHQPPVMRALDTVERHRCRAAPGPEDTDDG